MKRKNLILTLLIAFSLVLSSGAGANAGWFICTVDAAGPTQSGIYISLSDISGTFEKKWFRCPDNVSNEMLATALTAMTNNMKVSVEADSDQVYGNINIMYLLSPDY